MIAAANLLAQTATGLRQSFGGTVALDGGMPSPTLGRRLP